MSEEGLAPPLAAYTNAQSKLLEKWDTWGMPGHISDALLRGRPVESLTDSECIALKRKSRDLRNECSRAWETLDV